MLFIVELISRLGPCIIWGLLQWGRHFFIFPLFPYICSLCLGFIPRNEASGIRVGDFSVPVL